LIPIIDLKAQYQSIKGEIGPAIAGVLESCQFALGSEVAAFEQEFAAYCGAQSGVGVNSGTSALHLALLAAGVGPGDEVITVPFTFVATVAAICYTGAKPAFVDIEPRSYTMDASQLERVITERTKAVIPVHLYGQAADMDPIMEVARRHGLIVIEDAAQAHGGEYKGRRLGGIGDLGCFSFYPSKNLGACGEGGMTITNDADLAAKMRRLRDHGQGQKYYHDEVGFNYRMDGIQGAILRIKLRHLPEWNQARRRAAAIYRELLADADVVRPAEVDGVRHVYHLYVVRTPHRDKLCEYLKQHQVDTLLHYPVPIHLQKGYRHLGCEPGSLPQTERHCNEVLSLPMYAEMPVEAIKEVADLVCRFRP
jgi:dTDP-4-amino-4,6-dideoxygalactose transaminase